MRQFVTLHINWLITNASYYRNFKTRRERDCDPSRSWSRALSRFHEKLRPDELLKWRNIVPRTSLSLGAHIEFDTGHKSADDFTGYTTTSILSSRFHRTSRNVRAMFHPRA